MAFGDIIVADPLIKLYPLLLLGWTPEQRCNVTRWLHRYHWQRVLHTCGRTEW